MVISIEDRKIINRKQKKKAIAEKKAATIQQRTVLDALFARACRAVNMTTLHAVRRDKFTKVLTQKNYLDFIRVVDRLMESF